MIAALFAGLAFCFFAALACAFFWLTTPRKCPRCGARDWVRAPHVGPYWAYCRKCSRFVDFAKG